MGFLKNHKGILLMFTKKKKKNKQNLKNTFRNLSRRGK